MQHAYYAKDVASLLDISKASVYNLWNGYSTKKHTGEVCYTPPALSFSSDMHDRRYSTRHDIESYLKQKFGRNAGTIIKTIFSEI